MSTISDITTEELWQHLKEYACFNMKGTYVHPMYNLNTMRYFTYLYGTKDEGMILKNKDILPKTSKIFKKSIVCVISDNNTAIYLFSKDLLICFHHAGFDPKKILDVVKLPKETKISSYKVHGTKNLSLLAAFVGSKEKTWKNNSDIFEMLLMLDKLFTTSRKIKHFIVKHKIALSQGKR